MCPAPFPTVQGPRHRRPRGCKERCWNSKWAGFDAWDRRGSTSGRGSEVLGIVDGQPCRIDGILMDVTNNGDAWETLPLAKGSLI